MEVQMNLQLKVGDVMSFWNHPTNYVYVVLEISDYKVIVSRTTTDAGKVIKTDIETFSYSNLRSRWVEVGWDIL